MNGLDLTLATGPVYGTALVSLLPPISAQDSL